MESTKNNYLHDESIVANSCESLSCNLIRFGRAPKLCPHWEAPFSIAYFKKEDLKEASLPSHSKVAIFK